MDVESCVSLLEVAERPSKEEKTHETSFITEAEVVQQKGQRGPGISPPIKMQTETCVSPAQEVAERPSKEEKTHETSFITEAKVVQQKGQRGPGISPPIKEVAERPSKEEKTPETSFTTKAEVVQQKGQRGPGISPPIKMQTETCVSPAQELQPTISTSSAQIEDGLPGEGINDNGLSSILEQMKRGTNDSPAQLLPDGTIGLIIDLLMSIYVDYREYAEYQLRPDIGKMSFNADYRKNVYNESRRDIGQIRLVKCRLDKLGTAYENVTAKDDFGNTPLHYAAIGNCEEFVASYILKHPEIVNMQNNIGETPLHIAAKLNNFGTFKKLMNIRNVNVNLRCLDDGKTPLHYAVERGNTMMIELIKKKSPKVIEDHDGRSPLSYAAEKGLVEVASILIRDFPSSKEDSGPMLPLLYAAKNGQAEVVRLLVESPPEFLNTTDSSGQNCLDLAIDGNHCH